MAFSDFKNIAQVQKQYQIKYQEQNFIHVHDELLPESFLNDFKFFQENIDIYSSEASRSEIIISPLLREVYKHYYQHYSFWIQKSIFFDNILSGTPDYMFSAKSELGKTVLEKPIVMIVEAKKNDFEQGWGQCLAELVAAQKINENSIKPVYGIVTDGNLWQFAKLIESNFIKNLDNYTIDKLAHLYGTLNALLQLIELDNK